MEEQALNQSENGGTEELGNGLSPQYWLTLDGYKAEKCDNFKNALQLLIATYFVFNRTYPKSNASTLQFIQLYMCNMDTTNANRCRLQTFKNKAITLYRKVSLININDYIE